MAVSVNNVYIDLALFTLCSIYQHHILTLTPSLKKKKSTDSVLTTNINLNSNPALLVHLSGVNLTWQMEILSGHQEQTSHPLPQWPVEILLCNSNDQTRFHIFQFIKSISFQTTIRNQSFPPLAWQRINACVRKTQVTLPALDPIQK